MGEAHVLDIGNEPVRELVIGQKRIVRAALPGAEMHLVDADRGAGGDARLAAA